MPQTPSSLPPSSTRFDTVISAPDASLHTASRRVRACFSRVFRTSDVSFRLLTPFMRPDAQGGSYQIAGASRRPFSISHIGQITPKIFGADIWCPSQRKTAEKAEASTKTKAKKDPNAPKRNMSAYMFFSADWRERVKEENPEAGFGECISLYAL